MKDTENYKKLINAADRKDKTELQVYQNIDNCIEEVLEAEAYGDKISLIKSLIAYSEARVTSSFYIGLSQITYALLIGAVAILPSLYECVTDSDRGYEVFFVLCLVVSVLVLAAMFVWHGTKYDTDFKRTIIIKVLNDKLDELTRNKEKKDDCVNSGNIEYHTSAHKKSNKKNKKK